MSKKTDLIVWFEDLGSGDIAIAGGKNASLGEMIRNLKKKKIAVPDGFATTAQAYREFISVNELKERIASSLEEWTEGKQSLTKTGKAIRRMFQRATFSDELAEAIATAYRKLSEKFKEKEVDVAVRSSATAEDLPEASFAGQQETFLNVSGEDNLLEACKKCYASLFTDRAISYRQEKGFDHFKVALSVGVQKMVRADKAGSGVAFSLDTETGFPDVIVINAAWGLGENVVQGAVNPDEYLVFKPFIGRAKIKPIIDKELGKKEKKLIYATGGSQATKNVNTSRKEQASYVLSDTDILRLAEWVDVIERHYQKPMDIEWAKDGKTGELFIVQARPETVQSQKEAEQMKTYRLKEKGEKVLEGLAIGEAVASGRAQIIQSAEDIDQFEDGAILVTGMTDPDWVPIMKKASGIITEHGGRTSHAAIVSRELGVAAVVGTGDATSVLKTDQEITLSCAEGDTGFVYDGILDYDVSDLDLEGIPDTRTRIMMNIASPAAAFRWWRLPARGIGLARMEFIINNIIKAHPLALVHFNELEDSKAKKAIQKLTQGYKDKTEYFVDHLSRGVARIAASQHPDPVIVRMSDFKTNEYANLIGGEAFEPQEENPMLGFRGASRYYSEQYKDGFALECRAILKAREELGMENIVVMIPFCRTPDEADRVLEVMAKNGLKPGQNGLQVYVMCEIPSNIILADQFAQRFDGFSIGSNDLTQLILGVDRDSEELSAIFDERSEAVKRMIRDLIDTAHSSSVKVGICGQAPSDHPDFAEFLVDAGIDSVSLNPDSVVEVIKTIAARENSTSKKSKT